MLQLTVRIVISLLVVFGLLWGLAKLARRPLAGRGRGPLHVVARQQLTRGSAVAVVKVADRMLVLGVTDAGVTLLADADPELFDEQPADHRTTLSLPDAGPHPAGGLAGSVLSPRTWGQAIAFFRPRRGAP
jgi:flagellar protein FliO/FliZ